MFAAMAKLFGKASSGVIDAMVRQVAELSVECVCQRVATRVEEMTLSEARGYVRARAAQVVSRQARLAISRQPEVDVAWTSAIVRAATEQIVPLVLRQARVDVPRRIEARIAA